MEDADIVTHFLKIRHDILSGKAPMPAGTPITRVQWLAGLMAEPHITDRTYLQVLYELMNGVDTD